MQCLFLNPFCTSANFGVPPSLLIAPSIIIGCGQCCLGVSTEHQNRENVLKPLVAKEVPFPLVLQFNNGRTRHELFVYGNLYRTQDLPFVYAECGIRWVKVCLFL